MDKKSFIGRGSSNQQTGRFEPLKLERISHDGNAHPTKIQTEYFEDDTKSVVSQNNSPDLHFSFSLNPYRGCAHGCSYCYARPSHEYLGWGPGIDFESKIVVKRNAAQLFAHWLSKRNPDQVEPVMMSGVTDCYQPCERDLKITRACLETALEYRHPIQVITKNKLICRDLDLLSALADLNLVSVAVSITTLDQSLCKVMEPRTSSPDSRLQTIATLADANVPVTVSASPIIPGLNDEEIPAILERASGHGAIAAFYVMLRLPVTVKEVFVQWLQQNFPDRKDKIISRVQSLRDGNLNSSVFGQRMRGTGIWAGQIEQMFKLFTAKHNLKRTPRQLQTNLFRKVDGSGRIQRELF